MQTVADPLEHARLTAAHKEAVVCNSDRLDYQTLWSRCGRLAGYLAGLGLQRGDRVAVVAANCHRYLEVYLTVPSAGYVIVPLNTRSALAELEYAVADSQSRVLLTDREPSSLDSLFEHVIRLPDAYEQAIAGAEPATLGVDARDARISSTGTIRTESPHRWRSQTARRAVRTLGHSPIRDDRPTQS